MRLVPQIGLSLVLALAAGVRGEDTPVLDLNDHAAVATVVRDLGSESFQTRQKAQARLETLSPIHLEQLRQLARETADQEAQARILARVDKLEEILAIDPPGLSVSLPAGTIATVAEELTKATGLRIVSSGTNDRFQLDVKGTSFPRIIQMLNEQHPIWGSVSTSGLVIQRLTGVWQQSVIHRGFGVFIRDAALPGPAGARRGAVAAVNGGAAAGTSGYVVGIIADPRIRLMQLGSVEIRSAVDENKNQWLPVISGPVVLSPLLARPCVLTQSAQLVPPAKPGKSIVLLRGQFTAEVALAEERVEIANIAEKLNQPVTVGECEVTIQNVAFANVAGGAARQTIRLQMMTRPSAAAQGQPSAVTQGALVALQDADGNEIISRGFQRGVMMTTAMTVAAPANMKEPLKVIVTAPTKTRTITIPFEFKNLTPPQ